MGKLTEIHLCNFKSWAGNHVLHFGDSFFTSVIGPNGSGKSNTMDAISFVLGIKSSHLRSTHLRDLIYRGRVLKHSSKVDADGNAIEGASDEVDDENDDDDSAQPRKDPNAAYVMAVYEDDAGEEQRWKRTITSAGQSDYRINDRPVSAKQYNDALEKEHILIKARNFLVFQGDVEAVASQQPKDLTRLLEQISGSLEYAKEYETLRAEKERTEVDQNDKLLLRRSINTDIKIFQAQKQELEDYEEKREAKEQAIVTNVLWKLWHFQRTIEQSAAEIQKHQEELKEFRRSTQKHEAKLDEARREQHKAARKVTKVKDAREQLEKQAAQKEQDLIEPDQKLELSRKKLQALQKNLTQQQTQREEQVKNGQKLQKDYDTVQKAQKRWEADVTSQQQQSGRALSDEDLREYEQLRAEVYKQGGDIKVKVDNMTSQLKTDDDTVRSKKATIEKYESSVSTLQTDVDELKKRRAELSDEVKQANKDVQAKQVAIANLNSERTRTSQKRKELDEKLHGAAKKLEDSRQLQNESRKDTERRETVAQMRKLFPGVRGMIHQLCKPKNTKYETALPIILGRQWNSVVVDSEKTAENCIQHLREQRSGHMEFLPLDTIVHTQPNAGLRTMHRGARLAIDTIEFDASVERAMNSVCGNDMIADDWDIARELKWKRHVDAKIVTLDGRCITKADLISGGESLGDRKRRFEDVDTDALTTLVMKLKTEIDSLPNDHERQREHDRSSMELVTLRQRAEQAKEELEALDRNVVSKTKELDFTKTQLARDTPEYKELERNVNALRKQLESASAQVAQIEDEIFATFCQRLGFANIRDYERQQGALQEEMQIKARDFKAQLSRQANQLQYNQALLKELQSKVDKAKLAITRETDLISTLEAQREELAGELDELNARIEQLTEQIQALEAEHAERSEIVAESRKAVEKVQKTIKKTLDAVNNLNSEIERAAADRHIELRKCQVENIDFPLARGSRKLETVPLEDALPEEDDTAMDIDGEESIRIAKVKDHGIHPDFDALEDELKDDSSEERGTQLQERIVTLQSELDKMAPNMHSAERLESTSERFKVVDRDYNAAVKAKDKAASAFEVVKKKRMNLFKKAFAHISEQIIPVYRDLTKSKDWPMGGKAYLDVEDEDEPYLHGVKYSATPPNKRFREMELLSGGEKTMAALALLFAIHSYSPSPFFVLDEVDAALDVANTTRLANYVKEHAGPGMQFVVISLKTGLFQNSETLVGVMRDQSLNSSKALMLDLRQYQPA